MGEGHDRMLGCLEWLTRHTHQPWATWKWSTRGMRLNNLKPCSPRDDHPLRSVAGVQPGGTTPSLLHLPHSQPFPPLRRPGNWHPHPTCGVILESHEGEAETHEGLPPPPVARVTSTKGKDMGRLEKRSSPPSYKILHGNTQRDLTLYNALPPSYTSLPPFLNHNSHFHHAHLLCIRVFIPL